MFMAVSETFVLCYTSGLFLAALNGRRLNQATEFVPSEDPDLNVSSM